jgi:hypothetical protein
MPSKVRDTSPERRRDSSKKDGRRLEKVDSREHRRSSHRKSSSKDKADSKTSLPRDEMRRSSMPGILDTENAPPKTDSKTSLPYPTFSKEHSKETVAPRAGLDILTPPATDLNASKTRL